MALQSIGDYRIRLLAAASLSLDVVNVRNEKGLIGRLPPEVSSGKTSRKGSRNRISPSIKYQKKARNV